MDDKWNAESLPAEARELAMRSLAIAATKTKPVAGILQDFDLDQFINEEWEEEPSSIPGMGRSKHSITSPVKDLLASSSRPIKRRRLYQSSPTSATPAFIQSLISSPDNSFKPIQQRNFQRVQGQDRIYRNPHRRRGVSRPQTQHGRFVPHHPPAQNVKTEPVQPHAAQRGYIHSYMRGGVPNNRGGPHHSMANFRGQGSFNSREGLSLPPPVGRGGFSSIGMPQNGGRSLSQGVRQPLPSRGGHMREFRGHGVMEGREPRGRGNIRGRDAPGGNRMGNRGGGKGLGTRGGVRGRGINRGRDLHGGRGISRGRGDNRGRDPNRGNSSGHWPSTAVPPNVQQRRQPQRQERRGGWGPALNAPPNPVGGWAPSFPGRGRGQ